MVAAHCGTISRNAVIWLAKAARPFLAEEMAALQGICTRRNLTDSELQQSAGNSFCFAHIIPMQIAIWANLPMKHRSLLE